MGLPTTDAGVSCPRVSTSSFDPVRAWSGCKYAIATGFPMLIPIEPLVTSPTGVPWWVTSAPWRAIRSYS